MEHLYQIDNLECSYDGGESIVLKVDKLCIPKGKMIFILGRSGSGKSTLLETLGIMNKTLSKDSKVIFSPNGDEKKYDLSNIWYSSKKEHKVISDIRRNHLSFIFQSTNLMPNFSVIENICLPTLFSGQKKEYAFNFARESLAKVDLDLNYQFKKTHQVSGGEQQRIAFVRAFNKRFDVLFGDEPTGNLDKKNSEKLLNLIRNEIKEKATAIIVSHNIELSVQFADMIILIKKTPGYGEIVNDCIYEKEGDDFISQNTIIKRRDIYDQLVEQMSQ